MRCIGLPKYTNFHSQLPGTGLSVSVMKRETSTTVAITMVVLTMGESKDQIWIVRPQRMREKSSELEEKNRIDNLLSVLITLQPALP